MRWTRACSHPTLRLPLLSSLYDDRDSAFSLAVNSQDKLLSLRCRARCLPAQACLGVTRRQLGADKFGDVVKTGSGSALACVTLWNTVRALAQVPSSGSGSGRLRSVQVKSVQVRMRAPQLGSWGHGVLHALAPCASLIPARAASASRTCIN